MRLSIFSRLILIVLLSAMWVGAQDSQAQGEAKKETEKTEKKEEKKSEEEKQEVYIEEVKVTAKRVETDLMLTPIAVSAFTQETLDRQGIQSVEDMRHLVPNLDIATSNGQSTPIISMRGVRSTNETELGDPSVGIHLDGIYSPRMQGILSLMFDTERVEVLRGPQGTLFGRNSTVGSVNIITAKPDFSGIKAKVDVGTGRYNAQEVNVMYNHPVNDKLAFRFAGKLFQRDSYLDGYWDPNQYDQRHLGDRVEGAQVIDPSDGFSRTQHSNWWIAWADGGAPVRELVRADPEDFYLNADEHAYRISSRWLASERVTVDFSYQRYRNEGAGGVDLVNTEKLRGRPVRNEAGQIIGTNDGANLFPEDNPYQAVVNVPGRLFLDIDYLRTRVDWDINEQLDFVYLAGYEDQDRESAQDMEQSLNAWDGAMFFLPGTGSNSWMHEVQLQSYGNQHFNWISGANIFHEKTKTLGYYDNPINDKAFWDQPNRSSDSWAAFAQGTYSFNEKWHITTGIRYSDETKEDIGGRTFVLNNENGGPGWWNRSGLNALPADAWEDPAVYGSFTSNDNKGSWNHTDWRFGLDYNYDDKTLLYTYIASGFKSGGIGDVFHDINPRTGEEINVRTSFDPEEVITFEIGFKRKMFNNRLNLAATWFYSDYKDMQYASVGAIAFTDRWEVQRTDEGEVILDDNGEPLFGWVTAPIIAFYTQNVPGAEIKGFEIEYDWLIWKNARVKGYFAGLDTEITEDWVTKWNYDPVSYFGISFEESIDPTNEILEVNLKGNELAVSPPLKANLTFEQTLKAGRLGNFVPWFNVHWEDDSYLTIWNVDKHTDDLDFAIADEDVRYTDDRRESFAVYSAGIRYYQGNWVLEAYGYNLGDEVVQYWGGAAEGVAKGSLSAPATYGVKVQYKF